MQNKAKLLRLLHGDVYNGARLYRAGIIDTDRCIRCFAEETTKHLLIECPYSSEVWGRMGLVPINPGDLLNARLTKYELEVRAEIISRLVFRKKTVPPDVLIKAVVNSFKKGLSRTKGLKEAAALMVEQYEISGQWFT